MKVSKVLSTSPPLDLTPLIDQLTLACRLGNKEEVKVLLDEGVDVNGIDWAETTPLHAATENNYIDIVHLLIGSSGSSQNEYPPVQLNRTADLDTRIKGETALEKAYELRHAEIFAILLQNGANQKTSDGMPLIHKACEEEQEDIVRCFTAARLGTSSQYFGLTPLHVATRSGNKTIARLLLEAGADVNAEDSVGRSPLFEACEQGEEELITLLLTFKASINQGDYFGTTPLQIACKKGQLKAAILLLENGADPHKKNSNGRTALIEACSSQNRGVIDLLLGRCIGSEATGNGLWTPLHEACQFGRGYQELISQGVTLDAQDINGWTPLHLATQAGHLSAMSSLVKAGACIDAPDTNGYTPFHLAVMREDKQLTEFLLEHGANIALATLDKGNTPLHTACEMGNTTMIEFLLARGADINHPNKDRFPPYLLAKGQLASQLRSRRQSNKGMTPLHSAQTEEDISYCLQRGSDVNAVDNTGNTKLHLLCQNSSGEASSKKAALLLKASALIDVANEKSETPLHVAARNGSMEMTTFLLDNGAEPNKRDKDGKNTLHAACEQQNSELANLLIGKVDLHITDQRGRTPLHVAVCHGSRDIVVVLLEQGAKKDIEDKKGQTPLAYAEILELSEIIVLLSS